jgi:hypothetical protein
MKFFKAFDIIYIYGIRKGRKLFIPFDDNNKMILGGILDE